MLLLRSRTPVLVFLRHHSTRVVRRRVSGPGICCIPDYKRITGSIALPAAHPFSTQGNSGARYRLPLVGREGAERVVVCHQCGGEGFEKKDGILLNTRGLSFFGMEMFNKTACALTCMQCTSIQFFREEEMEQVSDAL